MYTKMSTIVPTGHGFGFGARVRRRGGNARLFTINSTPNNAFTYMPVNLKSRSLVAFRNYADASAVARMIDARVREAGDWPPHTDEGAPLILSLAQDFAHDTAGSSTFVRDWDREALLTSAARNGLGLILVKSIEYTDLLYFKSEHRL
jgi:hypothetical protein